MGFADVRAGTQKIAVLLSTRPNISESHSETSTRVPFCIAKTGPGRAVDIAVRVGFIEAQRLDAEAAGVGLHVELAAPVHERRTMSVVVRRENGLTELLHHDLVATQHRGVEIDRDVCACLGCYIRGVRE